MTMMFSRSHWQNNCLRVGKNVFLWLSFKEYLYLDALSVLHFENDVVGVPGRMLRNFQE